MKRTYLEQMLRQYELVERVKEYDPDADEAMLNRAYVYTVQKHGTQTRASGDPYFSHPVEVAGLMTDLKLDQETIATALLHDTVEDTLATIDDIEKHFGKDVARLVDGVTKLSKIEQMPENERAAENLRKFLLAMSEDIRVLLVKLGDRLHNMRTLHFIKKPEKRQRIARETMDIYAPLAERIGLDMEESFAYADGDEDVPLLASVGNPAAVNPRPHMAKAAEDRGWAILRGVRTAALPTPKALTRTAAAYGGFVGGTAIAAGLGGARAVQTVDVADAALDFARRSWTQNGLPPNQHETFTEDVPKFLEKARAKKETWDLIVSDPPSFAPKKEARSSALRAYRALHRSCLRMISDGGLYLAASCSSQIDREAFERTIADAAEKALVLTTERDECNDKLAKALSDLESEVKAHNALEKLKEAVAIYHWSKEAFANELQI